MSKLQAMSEKLRVIYDIKRIKSVLNNSKESSYSFVIWQTINEKRQMTKGVITKTLYKNHQIFIELNFQESISFNTEDYLYLFQEKLNLLFKGKISEKSERSCIVNLAPKIFLEENRIYERFEFSKLQIFVHLQLESQKKLSMQLENISETGLCFSSHTNKQSLFKPQSKLLISGIESIQLPQSIKANIIHSTIMNENNKMHLKVGIKFEKSSPIIKEVLSILNDI